MRYSWLTQPQAEGCNVQLPTGRSISAGANATPCFVYTTTPQVPITAHVGIPGSRAQMQINSCLNHADKAGWHSLELQVAHQPEVKPVYSTLQGNLKRQLFLWLLNFFVWVFLLSMIGRYWMSSKHPLACFPISGCHPQQHRFRSGIRAWSPPQYFSIPPSATWIISFFQ